MRRVLAAQVVLGVALTALIWIAFGPVAAYSVLLGSLISVVPNTFLALRLWVPRKDPGARALMRAAYIGELGKLALTVLMFSLVFVTVRPLSAGALFTGFIVTAVLPPLGALAAGQQQQETVDKHGK